MCYTGMDTFLTASVFIVIALMNVVMQHFLAKDKFPSVQ